MKIKMRIIPRERVLKSGHGMLIIWYDAIIIILNLLLNDYPIDNYL